MKKIMVVLLMAWFLVTCAAADVYLYPGSVVEFGYYEQDGNRNNGPEAIEWEVVSCDEEAVVMISKYGLDCVPFHAYDGDILWQDSTLRYWLNSVFYHTAFSQEEKSLLLTVVMDNPDNPSFGTYAGGRTEDMVFVPSAPDVQWHRSFSMQARPTRYAVQNGVHTNNKGYCWWWLRTPGKNFERVTHVTYEGKVYLEGTKPTTSSGAVRPCIALDVSKL
ncbi:MAG: hypothetical protein IJB85_13000 [Clostridia bacterium]|nr:hypothetical protein [Clostridia bacterium]